MHLMGVDLMGVDLKGMHLMGMHLMRFWGILRNGPSCQFTPPYLGWRSCQDRPPHPVANSQSI
jgi:hypothetical protein